MNRLANGLPEDLRDHARLMCDIIAIAFQTNKTRVASLIISRDLSAMYISSSIRIATPTIGGRRVGTGPHPETGERMPRMSYAGYASPPPLQCK
jgi:hypothetical protein